MSDGPTGVRRSFARPRARKLTYVPAPLVSRSPDFETSDPLRYLASSAGPHRFARVADGIYRGGQPDHTALELLRDLGVTTIINLRRESRFTYRGERTYAEELGMRFLHYPFYGVFGAGEQFLTDIVEEVKTRNVYIHCKHGRDRTSLIVALYRVMHEGWGPEDAWQREAIEYGSAQTYFYRQLRVVYQRMTEKFRRPAGTE